MYNSYRLTISACDSSPSGRRFFSTIIFSMLDTCLYFLRLYVHNVRIKYFAESQSLCRFVLYKLQPGLFYRWMLWLYVSLWMLMRQAMVSTVSMLAYYRSWIQDAIYWWLKFTIQNNQRSNFQHYYVLRTFFSLYLYSWLIIEECSQKKCLCYILAKMSFWSIWRHYWSIYILAKF